MKENDFYKIVAPFVPEEALEYCYHLWREHSFSFTITRDRKTKLGDFRYNRTNDHYSVTVNRGLNPYAFLVTYLHEVAHVLTYRQFRNKCKPHGPEWQHNFRHLATPLLHSSVFPDDVLEPLKAYLIKPAASTSGCAPLTLALRLYNKEEGLQILGSIASGCKFVFKNRMFIKTGRKRTRALCKDLGNGRNYLIPEVAEVFAVA